MSLKYGVGTRRIARLTRGTTPIGLLISAKLFLLLLLLLLLLFLLLLLLVLLTCRRYGDDCLAHRPLFASSHHITVTASFNNCPLSDFGYINDKPISLLHMPPPLHRHYLGAAAPPPCISNECFPLLLVPLCFPTIQFTPLVALSSRYHSLPHHENTIMPAVTPQTYPSHNGYISPLHITIVITITSITQL